MRIIHKALDDELDSEDLDILKNDIAMLSKVEPGTAKYERDSQVVLHNSQTIINAVTNIYKNTH